MLKLVDADQQTYGRPSYRDPNQRWWRGQSYNPPPVNQKQTVSGVKIEEGKRYRVVPRKPLPDVRGIMCIKTCTMIAVKNRRGEMMLCHIRDGEPFGGYILHTFLTATPV